MDTGDFAQAWGGIAGVQLGLMAVWAQARARGFALASVVQWMAAGPSHLLGLDGRKGALAVGQDADFAVFAPDDEQPVIATQLHHKNPVTPYEGQALAGVVRSTWLRGHRIVPAAPQPVGEFLTRP
jgi:allantoinase